MYIYPTQSSKESLAHLKRPLLPNAIPSPKLTLML